MRGRHERPMRLAPDLLAFVLITSSAEPQAHSLTEIGRRDNAVIEAWQRTPLTVRRALFVVEHATGFGMYTQRQSNVFKPGEELIAYAEPVGYGWKPKGTGLFEFGFDVGFVIKKPNGEILGGNQNFAHLVQT